MIVRISLSVLMAACVLWPSIGSAQYDPNGGYCPPGTYAGAYAPQSGLDVYGDGSGYEASVYQPQPMPWEREGRSPLRQFIREVLPNTYVRLEYLSWNVDDVGSSAVGGPTLRELDVNNQFSFGAFNIDNFVGSDLIVPTTEPISFNKVSGLRGTFGIPLTFGALEFSAFGLQNDSATIRNAIPGQSTLGDFTVPANTTVVVPATSIITFPNGATVTQIPGTLNRVFTPPLLPTGMPVSFATFFGDQIAAGSVFTAGTTTAVGIPLTQNSGPGITTLIYDVSYSADYHNEVWGSEAKLILDIGPDANGLTLKPVIGFRYMQFDEQFTQVGVTSFQSNILRGAPTLFTSNSGIFLPPNQPSTIRGPNRTSIIDSTTENSLYGLQVGTRAEYNHKWFTLAVDPRISLGVNNYTAEVTTTNLRNAFDGVVRTEESKFEFAPVFDVSMYGQVHLTPYFSLHAGYNFTYLFDVSRPDRNILYNDNGPNAPPGIVVDAKTEDVHIEGLTIGGEFRFRDLKFR